MKELGYGKNYKYAHAYEGNFTQEQFMPEIISSKVLYEPQENEKELQIRKRLSIIWKGKYKYL